MKDLKKLATDEMSITKGAIQNFPWEDATAYKIWLAQTYHMVKHSTRLVALAAAYTELSNSELHMRFIDHAKEERSHELICVRDLKAMNAKIDEFPVLYPPVVMAQTQYYWVQHHGPISLFGYILSLECMAAQFGPAIYKRTTKAHGEQACHFVKVHAHDDVDHVEKAFHQLKDISPRDRQSVIENFEISANLYRVMLSEVAGFAKKVVPLKRAA